MPKSRKTYEVNDKIRYIHPAWGPCTGYFVRTCPMGIVITKEIGGKDESCIPYHWICL